MVLIMYMFLFILLLYWLSAGGTQIVDIIHVTTINNLFVHI